jgi:hypothetical protein
MVSFQGGDPDRPVISISLRQAALSALVAGLHSFK